MRGIGVVGIAETVRAGFLHVATRIQRVVIMKPEAGAVILVRATARDRIEYRARVATILSAELICHQSHFLNRVRIVQGDRRSGNAEVVVVLTVDHEVVRTRAAAVGREVCAAGESALARVYLAHTWSG